MGRIFPIANWGAASSTLLTGLTAYWKLDEASGSRADSVGGNTLTDNNTVTQAAGKIGSSALFVSASSQYLSHASNAALQTGNADFTVAAWIKPTALAFGFIVAKDTATGVRDWGLRLADASGHCSFAIWDGATSLRAIVQSTAVLTNGAWNYVVVWFDAAAGRAWIQINNGTPLSAAKSGNPGAGAAPFVVGGAGAATSYIGAAIDEVGFWKRVLTADERAALYNGGAGVTYPF